MAIVASLKTWRVYAEKASELTIYIDHKNLLHFTTTKQLNRRQVRWSELLEQYKFKILYTPKKENGRADALSRRNDHMKSKEIFKESILKVNKNGSLSANKHELEATLRILRNDQKQFSIEKEKLQISKDKIDECIKKHHDEPLQEHSDVSKTLQLLRQTSSFLKMREKVEAYINDALAVKRISTPRIRLTAKFGIRNHRNRHGKKSQWTSLSSYQSRRIQSQKKNMMQYWL